MRSIAMIIALLAAGKLGYQEYAYRITLADVVMTTYRQDAVVACQREAAQRNLSVSYVSWTKPEEMSLEVGRSGSDSKLGGLGDRLLDFGPRDPYLVIVARKLPFKIICEFDIVRQVATVSRN